MDDIAGEMPVVITAGDHALETTLWPKLTGFLASYPDIKVEIAIDYGLTDIAAARYDAGVRWGEQVAKDMIAVRIGPDVRFAVVGAKSYFAKRPPPKTPQDLIAHNCINLRLPTCIHSEQARAGVPGSLSRRSADRRTFARQAGERRCAQ